MKYVERQGVRVFVETHKKKKKKIIIIKSYRALESAGMQDTWW